MTLTISDILLDGLYYYFLFNFVFYGCNLILYFVDMLTVSANYKLQPRSKAKLHADYVKCLDVSVKNTFLYNLPAVIMMPILINWYGFSFSWAKTIFDLVMSYVLMDLVYYLTHRVLHFNCFYAKYHKKHHEMTAPVGLSATYLTVVDFYSNIVSIYLPPILLSVDRTTMSMWIIISTLNTIFIGHSGYNPIASFHDNHHKYFNCNYGVGVFADRLFGTRYSAGSMGIISNSD